MPGPTTIRGLWKLYKLRGLPAEISVREEYTARLPFYGGIIGMCRALKFLTDRGPDTDAVKAIERAGGGKPKPQRRRTH
jgi:hypothetical protein